MGFENEQGKICRAQAQTGDKYKKKGCTKINREHFLQWQPPRNGNNINLLESVLSLNADEEESSEDEEDRRRL